MITSTASRRRGLVKTPFPRRGTHHPDRRALCGAVVLHASQFLDGGRAGLLEEDVGDTMIYKFVHIPGHVRGTRADHGHHVPVGLGHVGYRCMESNFPFVLGLEGRELGAAGAVGAAPEEPRFYYVRQRGGRDVAVQNLLGLRTKT